MVESGAPGPSPGSLPFLTVTSSRKEKKKQAKEERDRLKQAEKKKRRLEKALATAAAIRTELEKKKQRRKEEEQRLDEEGAALAEAVALQVLVDEDSDGLGRPQGSRDAVSAEKVEESSSLSAGSAEKSAESPLPAPCLGVRRREPGQQNGLKRHGSSKFSFSGENSQTSSHEKEMEWKSDWKGVEQSMVARGGRDNGSEGESIAGDEGGLWEVNLSSAEERARASNERATAAEVAAGLAAAQAVAALRIAEEARAEAEAAKRAAEAAMNEALDRRDSHQKQDFLDEVRVSLKILVKSDNEALSFVCARILDRFDE